MRFCLLIAMVAFTTSCSKPADLPDNTIEPSAEATDGTLLIENPNVDPAFDPQAELTEAQVKAMEEHAAQQRASKKAQAQQDPPTDTDTPGDSLNQTTRSP